MVQRGNVIVLQNKYLVALIFSLLITGCSQPPRGGPREKTYPVTGVVVVDGEPTEMVEVVCHPDGESSKIKYDVSTMTDKDGQFSLTTYQSGDGLPEGTYILTFKWMEPGFVPKDKFKGAYADPTKSTQKVTVVTGQKNDLGEIELSSKGPG
jgi:hypothetical protein